MKVLIILVVVTCLLLLSITMTSCGCEDDNTSTNNDQYSPNTDDDQYRGIDQRTEENVADWQYDGSRSEDGIDWEFIDRAREAYETGK